MRDGAITFSAVLTIDGHLGPGWLTFTGERITAVGSGDPPAGEVLDLGNRVLAAGFVDLHVHGGNGGQAAGADPGAVAEEVLRAARFHAQHGTTRLVATTVSDTPERLIATVAGVRRAIDTADPDGASIAGIHLEGPWLAPSRRGAHDPSTLRHPDLREFEALQEAGGGAVRLVTIAPELPGAEAVIAAAAGQGVVVSVGHTEATYDEACRAFDSGARHLTHLGNAMAPIDRRQPGPIAAALTDDRITVEVIADGEHVHPAMLQLVASAAPGRLVAITDAIAATGLADGGYLLGTLAVNVTHGRAVLADAPDILAGSVLTMERAIATLVRSGMSAVDALSAASATPARVLGEEGVRGVLGSGHRADLVILDEEWNVCATVIAGHVVHDPSGLLA